MPGFVFGKGAQLELPEIGLGTWKIGGTFTADRANDRKEVEAIAAALDMGYRFIDTAEMYGAGHCEELVGKAIGGRDGVIVGTKVWQTNLSYDQVLQAAERSMRRLGVSRIDLYQIHWPSDSIPLRETMRALEKLKDEGKIGHIGVCNFGVELLEDAASYLSHTEIVSDQIRFNLLERGAEEELIPYCRRQGMGIIAYEPLSRQKVFKGAVGEVLKQLSERNGKSPAQIALNWIICKGALPIPKSTDRRHLKENLGAAGWRLTDREIGMLDETQ